MCVCVCGWLAQDHYIFDLEDPVEYECVSLMRKRIMKYRLSQEEFWMHVRFNDQVGETVTKEQNICRKRRSVNSHTYMQ